MLRHLGLSCLNGGILFRCQPFINPLRSIHIHHSRQSPSGSPPSAIEDPGWVMLSRQCIRTEDSFVTDAKTVAYSRTYTGHHLRVSFRGAPPPASSFIYYDFPDTAPGKEDDSSEIEPGDDDYNVADECEEEDGDDDECEEEDEYDVAECHLSVVAAHEDTVLLKLGHRCCPSGFWDDHFLYRTGATSPPLMSLLPDRDFLTKSEQVYEPYVSPPVRPIVHGGTTALLKRGDDDILLVQLHIKYDRSLKRDMAEFCLLRHGSPQWELRELVPIILDEGRENIGRLRTRCGTNTIILLGDRFLCWVRYESGFLLCDMAEEASPKVRYVPLPPGVCWDPKEYEEDMSIKHSMNMGAAGSSALRFVSIEPHCCCGGPGKTTCAQSLYAFTINTWKMNIDTDDPLMWVKDGEIDCEELWALPGYEGLPRANPMCPIVSLDNPNVVCFLVSNCPFVSRHEDLKLWMIQFNINTKKLLSVVQYTGDTWGAYRHLPARLHYQC